MKDHRILNGFAYFSVIFAPVIFPSIVWIVAKDPTVKVNAKSALVFHLIPGITVLFTIVMLRISYLLDFSTGQMVAVSVLYLLSFVIIIHALFIGIKQLIAK